jgi:hypothetical protein
VRGSERNVTVASDDSDARHSMSRTAVSRTRPVTMKGTQSISSTSARPRVSPW